MNFGQRVNLNQAQRIATMLTEQSASDTNSFNKKLLTPLMLGVATGNLRAVQFAIDYNKKVPNTFNFNI